MSLTNILILLLVVALVTIVWLAWRLWKRNTPCLSPGWSGMDKDKADSMRSRIRDHADAKRSALEEEMNFARNEVDKWLKGKPG